MDEGMIEGVDGGSTAMAHRKPAVLLFACALLVVALGAVLVFWNWWDRVSFTADCLPDDRVSMEEYEVYVALINSGLPEDYLHDPFVYFAALGNHTVPLSEQMAYARNPECGDCTESKPLSSLPVMQILVDTYRADRSASTDFFLRNQRSYSLEPRLHGCHVPYFFGSSEDATFREPPLFHCGLFYGFSRVGFNPDMDSAVLTVTSFGMTYPIVMSKDKGEWCSRPHGGYVIEY